MSAARNARREQIADERRPMRAPHPRPRPRLALARALFSTGRSPFAALEIVLFAVLLLVGANLVQRLGGMSEGPAPWFVVASALVYGALTLGLGSYDEDQRFRRATIVRTTILAVALTLVASLILGAAWGQPTASAAFVGGAALATAGVMLARFGMAWMARRNPYRFSVYGSSARVDQAVSYLASHRDTAGLRVLVPIDTIAADPTMPSAAELAGATLSAVIVAGPRLSDEAAIHLALACLEAGVPAIDEHTFYARSLERMPIDDVPKRWFLEHGIARPSIGVVALKRLSDIGLSALGLVVLGPLLLMTAAAIRMTSPGPVFYVQERQGRFLRPFRMLKFRTMRHDPEGQTEFTAVADARVTAVGRILRRLHADELPQLINILRGDMAVVGPRPEVLDFARRMEHEVPLYGLRYVVRPGLTGHAQLKQGYAMDTVEDTRIKLSYDLFYLRYFSLRMDVRILLRTAMFLIRGSR